MRPKGSITEAVASARSVAGFALRIHVECQSLAEAREAISAGADIIMLDNFSPEELVSAAKSIKDDWVQNGGREAEGRGAKRCLVEVSGGLTEENMEKWLCDGEFSVRLPFGLRLTPLYAQTWIFCPRRRFTKACLRLISVSRFSPRTRSECSCRSDPLQKPFF